MYVVELSLCMFCTWLCFMRVPAVVFDVCACVAAVLCTVLCDCCVRSVVCIVLCGCVCVHESGCWWLYTCVCVQLTMLVPCCCVYIEGLCVNLYICVCV